MPLGSSPCVQSFAFLTFAKRDVTTHRSETCGSFVGQIVVDRGMGPMWASFRLAVLLLCLIAGRAFVVQPSARSRLAPSSTRAGWTRSSVSTVTGQGPASQGRVKSIVLMSSPGAAAGAKTGTKVLVKERVAEKVEVR
ncbi:unnamed protein product [Choristocarpus tenellus]